MRTNRNRNLITLIEQKKLEKSTIGIIGLSIGSAFARNFVQQGIARNLKLVEFDSLETTNLNRIYAMIADLGSLKLQIIAKQIYDLDPYWRLDFNTRGINTRNLHNFLMGSERVGLIFEAIDDLKMKIRLRLAARKYHIPVVMFTNLGDRVMVDIERYDKDKNLKLFKRYVDAFPNPSKGTFDHDFSWGSWSRKTIIGNMYFMSLGLRGGRFASFDDFLEVGQLTGELQNVPPHAKLRLLQ